MLPLFCSNDAVTFISLLSGITVIINFIPSRRTERAGADVPGHPGAGVERHGRAQPLSGSAGRQRLLRARCRPGHRGPGPGTQPLGTHQHARQHRYEYKYITIVNGPS